MALSEQERKCVEAVCRFLSETRGGDWRIPQGATLDEMHPMEPSPEGLITDGISEAAVEVKRLGNDVVRPYAQSVRSLERYLAPPCGGYYVLSPCSNLSFPLDHKMMRYLKREIERVAPSMHEGDEAPIRMERSALLVIRAKSGTGLVHCCHNDFDLLRDLSSQLDGVYALLVDQGQMEHSFLTAAAQDHFAHAVLSVARSGTSQAVTWWEEWPLTRTAGDETGVWVLGTSGAFDVQTSVSISAERMIEQSLVKFRGRRWADFHVVALESDSQHMTPERVAEAMAGFDAAELAYLDLVLLVVDGAPHLVWAAARPEPGGTVQKS